MAANKSLERGTPLQFVCPTTVRSGNAVVLRGTLATASEGGRAQGMAMVANEDYNATSGLCSFDLNGAFLLPVLAESAESPAVNSPVAPGDRLYANINTGTYDAVTGFLTGFTIDKNQSGIYFGNALDAIGSGLTATIRVRIKEGN